MSLTLLIAPTIKTEWEDAIIRRRNRVRTMTAQVNPRFGKHKTMRQRLALLLLDIPLPPGYQFLWSGQYFFSAKGQKALFGRIPPALVLMVLISILFYVGCDMYTSWGAGGLVHGARASRSLCWDEAVSYYNAMKESREFNPGPLRRLRAAWKYRSGWVRLKLQGLSGSEGLGTVDLSSRDVARVIKRRHLSAS